MIRRRGWIWIASGCRAAVALSCGLAGAGAERNPRGHRPVTRRNQGDNHAHRIAPTRADHRDTRATTRMTPEREDVWASGDAYEPYVGRWSRLVAREFLAWLGLPPDLRWLDVGSGTGALSQVILETATPREVVGVDQSAGYVAYAGERLGDPRA